MRIQVKSDLLHSTETLTQICSPQFRYLADRTTQMFEIKSARKVPFPAVTVCPSYNVAYNRTALEVTGILRSLIYYLLLRK